MTVPEGLEYAYKTAQNLSMEDASHETNPSKVTSCDARLIGQSRLQPASEKPRL